MNYYAMQVVTTQEGKFLRRAAYYMETNGLAGGEAGRLIVPRRALTIRKRGVVKNTESPIFPGYVFLETESMAPRMYWLLKRIEGFCRFLKDNHNIEPLTGTDAELFLHFLSFGEVVERSKVFFDEDNRIQVIDGPLKGLEGLIIKVDRRKCRAKVRLSLYDNSFPIDLGFDQIEQLAGVKP